MRENNNNVNLTENNVNAELFTIKEHKNNNNNPENEIQKITIPKEETKVSRIQKCIKEMIMNTTIHALPIILKTEKIYLKILLFIFSIISIGFNFQLVTKYINDYLTYETITKINTGFD